MKTIIDSYTTREDLTDFTLRWLDERVQRERQEAWPRCQGVLYRLPTGEDAEDCNLSADGYDPGSKRWLCRTCAEQLEVKFAEA